MDFFPADVLSRKYFQNRAVEICDLGGTVPPQISLVKLEVGSRICKSWKVKAKSWKLEATFEKKLENVS